MSNWDDCLSTGQSALSNLYGMQAEAMQHGNIAAQKALEDDIDDLTYKLTQARALQIQQDDTQIVILNTKLSAITHTAQSVVNDIENLNKVLANVVAAAKILDSLISAAMKFR